MDYEDAKDLPIELRRLEDFEDIPEPLSSVGLKSRSLGSILNPPPKQIVRSRSSVPSLGAEMPQSVEPLNQAPVSSFLLTSSASTASARRPKLIKQKQSISDDLDFPPNETSAYYHLVHNDMRAQLLRKQSSLNEELMAESRIREKERIRKRIQKQMSLNESFLCRSVFTKRLQVIREGFTTKLKSSTGSLERVTKNSLVRIMQNIKSASNNTSQSNQQETEAPSGRTQVNNCPNSSTLSRKLSSGSFQKKPSACSSVDNDENEKIRRLSRESGSGE